MCVHWAGKDSTFQAGDGSIPGSGSSPGEGNWNPLQYSCLGSPLDRRAWRATVLWGFERVRHDWATFTFKTSVACDMLIPTPVPLKSLETQGWWEIFFFLRWKWSWYFPCYFQKFFLFCKVLNIVKCRENSIITNSHILITKLVCQSWFFYLPAQLFFFVPRSLLKQTIDTRPLNP